MATTIRSLCDKALGRTDMIGKGTILLLKLLIPYCDDNGYVLIITSLFNFMRTLKHFPPAIFDYSVTIVSEITALTNHPGNVVYIFCRNFSFCSLMAPLFLVCLQYAAAEVFAFTREETNCRKPLIVSLIIKTLPKLLASPDSLTQFYAVAASGNLFFNNLCSDLKEIKPLLKDFVEAGLTVTDGIAVLGLTLALAKLSQEEHYMDILITQSLLDKVLDLLLKYAKIEGIELAGKLRVIFNEP